MHSAVRSFRTPDRVTLGVEHFGDAAAPLLLLAGGTTMPSWPDPLCAALARGGRHVVRYDLRDSGTSTTVDPVAPGLCAARPRRRRRRARPRTQRATGASGGYRCRWDGRPDRRARPPGRVLGAHPRRDATRRTWPSRRRPARPRRGDDGPTVRAPDARLVRPRCRSGVCRRPRGNPRQRPGRGTRDRRARLRPHTEHAARGPDGQPVAPGVLQARPHAALARAPARARDTGAGGARVGATGSSPSATARRSRGRSLARGCSCSNRPRPRSPTRPPMRSQRRCWRCRRSLIRVQRAHGHGADRLLRRSISLAGLIAVRRSQERGFAAAPSRAVTETIKEGVLARPKLRAGSRQSGCSVTPSLSRFSAS